jgi:hypothetical protein
MASFRSSPLLPGAKKALGAGESNIISVTQSQLFMRFNGVDGEFLNNNNLFDGTDGPRHPNGGAKAGACSRHHFEQQ